MEVLSVAGRAGLVPVTQQRAARHPPPCAGVRTVPHHSMQPAISRRKMQQWTAQRERRRLHIAPAAEAPSSSSSSSSNAAAAEQQATAQGGEIDPWYLEQVSRMEAEGVSEEASDYMVHLQQTFTVPGAIEFSANEAGLPRVTLSHPNGSAAELYLHGAAVTSWVDQSGRELLHLRPGNAMDGRKPISGGVSLAWPQYGAGALPTHGFARHLHWSVVETHTGAEPADPRPNISLYAESDPAWGEAWPHAFQAVYTVCLCEPDPPEPDLAAAAAEAFGGDVTAMEPGGYGEEEAQQPGGGSPRGRRGFTLQRPSGKEAAGAEDEEAGAVDPPTASQLRCILAVHNSGDAPFTFTTGLRPHFATENIATHGRFVKSLGLWGKYVLDYVKSPLLPRMDVEEEDFQFFDKGQQVDRIYVDAAVEGEVKFCPGNLSHIELQNAEGFCDVGLQHPAASSPADAARFVCMPAARVSRPVTLQPGESWTGEMRLTAHNRYWELPPFEESDPSTIPLPPASEAIPSARWGGQSKSHMLSGFEKRARQ